MFGKDEFSQVFQVGEVIESGADPNRKNAAHLKILAIEDDFVRYQSLRSVKENFLRYPYLQLLLDNFADINPKSIQNSVNSILKKAGLPSDYWTENYAYSFAKAFHERTQSGHLQEGALEKAASIEQERLAGFKSNPAIRKAVEMYAMERAKIELERSGYRDFNPTYKYKCYDYTHA